jgi:mannose-6-phosphate isomerase-like protein (cupin superfamily)
MSEWFKLGATETRWPIASVGGPMRVLVDAMDSGARMSILEQRMDEPGGPPLHVHPENDEWMMVIEGGPLTVQLGSERRELHCGESVWMPRGTHHTFNNLSGKPLRVLAVVTPAGVEEALHEQALYLQGLRGAPDVAAIEKIWGARGKIVGPPIR